MSLIELKELINQDKPMEALAIADEMVGKGDYSYAIRGLLREWVYDLDNARKDLELDSSNDFLVEKISLGRVLAKLGYGDRAYEHLSELRSDQIITCPGHHLPMNFGILHSHYESPFMEQLDRNHFNNDLAYSYFLRGEEDRLDALENSNGLLNTIKKFDLPSGVDLREISRELNQEIMGIRGWLSPSEASILYYYASQCPVATSVVELGSFYGRSTICLGKGVLAGNRNPVIAVDPHLGIEAYSAENSLTEISKNLARSGLDQTVEINRTTSLEAAENYDRVDIGLLFIDALHDYANVKADFEAWERKIVDEGIVMFHDTMLPGVNQFLIELLQNTDHSFQALGFRDSIFVFQKKNSVDRAKNQFFADLIKDYGLYFHQWQKADKETIKWRLDYFLGKMEALPQYGL